MGMDEEGDIWVPEGVGVTGEVAVGEVREVGVVRFDVGMDVKKLMETNVAIVARDAMETILREGRASDKLALLGLMLDRVHGKAVQQISADIRSIELKKIEVNFV
jgi:hypothetical protein